jgi:hypothetical protein
MAQDMLILTDGASVEAATRRKRGASSEGPSGDNTA